jgi:predicted nucleic acid-binding protein
MTVEEAARQLRSWLGAPAVVVIEPTARHADVLLGLIEQSGTAGNLVPDAHLAALASEHAATIVTFDTDFGRFPGVRSRRPGGS